MKKHGKFLRRLLMIIIVMFYGSKSAPTNVIFVNLDASKGGDGTSWDNAFTDIQGAIDKAVPLQLTTDIDGGKLIVDVAVDIGAFEYKLKIKN